MLFTQKCPEISTFPTAALNRNIVEIKGQRALSFDPLKSAYGEATSEICVLGESFTRGHAFKATLLEQPQSPSVYCEKYIGCLWERETHVTRARSAQLCVRADGLWKRGRCSLITWETEEVHEGYHTRLSGNSSSIHSPNRLTLPRLPVKYVSAPWRQPPRPRQNNSLTV
uniref:Uncharacterized protein n=1 Tax=Steinernema glaseri TaxID=37863 RepID=A0A1I7ZYH3_9BILA